MPRDDFPNYVKNALADRVANRCCNPDCNATTSGPQTDPARAINIGVAAHITAASPGGARYDASLTAEQRSAAENGIWLCQNCAAKIDRDENQFTVQVLQDWKALSEIKTRLSLGKPYQTVAETESQRKMRKILDMRKPGQMVTLRYLNASQHAALLGRVKAEVEVFVLDCNEDTVFLRVAGSDTNKAFSLETVMIGHDDIRQRPALENKP